MKRCLSPADLRRASIYAHAGSESGAPGPVEIPGLFARRIPGKAHAVRFACLRLNLLALAAVLAASILRLGAADGEADRIALAVEALTRLEGVDLGANAALKARVLQVLDKTRGTANFVKLVQHFKLPDQNAGLLEVAIAQPSGESGVEAMRLILASGDTALLRRALEGTNTVASTKAGEALGSTGDKRAVKLLLPVLADSTRDIALRKQAVRSLARTSEGAGELLKLAKHGKLAEDLKFTASAELNAVRWPELRAEAAKILPPAQGRNATSLPPWSELMRTKGDPANGARIFTNASPGCSNCHVVHGRGVDLGPNLSEIGTKLGKDALMESILEPSSGVSFGYEAWNFTLKSGDEVYGLLASETADEVVVKNVGGIITRLKKRDIQSRQQSKLSIMPAGLQAAMTTQELVDLVEYLATLKKAGSASSP
jgi:putative heme-binding domain-containing protein